MSKAKILICDDDELFILALKQVLQPTYDCVSAKNGDEALAILKNRPIDLVLLDVQMRTSDEGLKTLPKIKEINPEIDIIMSTGVTDFSTVREALLLGACNYVPKDFDPNDLKFTVEQVLERRNLIKRKEQQSYEVASHQKRHVLIGKSTAMEELRKTIERVKKTSANVIITGETGTGKEVVARQLRRSFTDGSLVPFIAVDSATIQGSTAESTLFGHEKGAFTGAEKTTKGIFEEANGGIVYFDEIGNMPLEIQAKLLRVLQEKEVLRMGSSRPIQLEFQVICATNKNLEEMVKNGEFKEDLLQRLSVIPLHLRPLRERASDIPDLLRHFLQQQGADPETVHFTDAAVEILQNYNWPGNIRELNNLVAYLLTMTDGPEIDVSDLPPKVRETRFESSKPTSDQNFYHRVSEFEKRLLKEHYDRLDGNVAKLALELGMDRSHLYNKLKTHQIHTPRKSN